jgi:hypothetical protein
LADDLTLWLRGNAIGEWSRSADLRGPTLRFSYPGAPGYYAGKHFDDVADLDPPAVAMKLPRDVQQTAEITSQDRLGTGPDDFRRFVADPRRLRGLRSCGRSLRLLHRDDPAALSATLRR